MQFDNSRPVWLQLVEEFTRLIVTGEWEAGKRVPSTRELAVHYRVNPNTVQKALTEMDRRGHTQSERTSGRTVLASGSAAEHLKESESAALADRTIEQLIGLGLTAADVRALFERRLEDYEAKEVRNDGNSR